MTTTSAPSKSVRLLLYKAVVRQHQQLLDDFDDDDADTDNMAKLAKNPPKKLAVGGGISKAPK